MILSYQNCAPTTQADGAGTNSSLQYTEMSPSAAQSMADSVDTMCATAGTAVSMGAAPATISSGTLSVPINATYTLSGGTTSIAQAYGNLFVVGTGTVILDGTITGNVIVCGASVSYARIGGGNLFIQNGNVGNIQSFTGNIALSNGEPIGSISKMLGNLVWKKGGSTVGRTYNGL